MHLGILNILTSVTADPDRDIELHGPSVHSVVLIANRASSISL